MDIFDGTLLTPRPFPGVITTSFVFSRVRGRLPKSKRPLLELQVQWHLPKVGQICFDDKNYHFSGTRLPNQPLFPCKSGWITSRGMQGIIIKRHLPLIWPPDAAASVKSQQKSHKKKLHHGGKNGHFWWYLTHSQAISRGQHYITQLFSICDFGWLWAGATAPGGQIKGRCLLIVIPCIPLNVI